MKEKFEEEVESLEQIKKRFEKIGSVSKEIILSDLNEAIAHFKTDNKNINEYLYCYLKRFNYQTMGSTSSIATAVNSKIIKGEI